MKTIDLECERCGSKKAIITISGPHYKANCSECGRYIKFVPKAQIEDKPQIVKDMIEVFDGKLVNEVPW